MVQRVKMVLSNVNKVALKNFNTQLLVIFIISRTKEKN